METTPIATILTLVLLTAPALAGGIAEDVWGPADRLTHVQPNADSDFGRAVDVDGDVAVVGDPSQDRVHVYEKTESTWLSTQTLEGPEEFGSSVAIDGDTIVVGAPDASVVHVYESGVHAWSQTTSLTVSGASCLGSSVDVHAGTIIVGEPCSTEAAYLFEPASTGWVRSDEATVPGEPNFGRDVAIGQDTAAVAAGGAAYVLRDAAGSGWSDPAELKDTESAGWSVAIDGDSIAVGGLGVAVVFDRAESSSWLPEATLEPGDVSPFHDESSFGRSVALSGDTLVVGAFTDDPTPGAASLSGEFFDQCASQFGFGVCAPPRPGAAYVFEAFAEAWEQEAKLSPEVLGDGQFGAAVAVDGGQEEVLVGAPHNLKSAIGGAIDVDVDDAVYAFQRGFSP